MEDDDCGPLSMQDLAAQLEQASARRASARANLKMFEHLRSQKRAMEAALWAKECAYALGEAELRELVCMLSDAILDPKSLKRKRGDKFVNMQTIEKLVAEVALANKVRSTIEASKARSRPGRKEHVLPALKKIAENPKMSVSKSTAKRRYYKHK